MLDADCKQGCIYDRSYAVDCTLQKGMNELLLLIYIYIVMEYYTYANDSELKWNCIRSYQ